MRSFKAVLLGTLVLLALGTGTAAFAAVTYNAILDWTGPYFRIINSPGVDQMVNNPVTDMAFVRPLGVAAREHTTGQRDVVYVLDSGHNRVQAFEVNAGYATDNTFTWQAGGAAAADDYDDNEIRLHEWAAGASRFVIPGSEVLVINGSVWGRVNDLTGFTSSDKVYTVDYTDATNAPVITLPAGSLTSTSKISVKYALSDNYTGAADAFGLGDVDYGTGAAGTPVLTEIDEASGGPTSWQTVEAISLTANEATATSDDIFLLDCADNSAGQNEELFYYTVSAAGAATYREAYDDVLTNAYGLAVATGGTEIAAAATVSADTGPFDLATAAVADANQVTGHTYNVDVAAGNVTITDATTGRVIVASTAFANLDDPCLAIPGLTLPLNLAVGTSVTIATTRAVPDRYLFVADTGADRIKVIGASDDTPTATNDWLPGDAHTMVDQPAGAGLVGATADEDYRYATPATPGANYAVWTSAYPIKQGSLDTITFDPDGTPVAWTRIDNLITAGPTAKVYTVDWTSGKITFGDGIHGAIPTGAAEFEFTYTTTPDVLHYGVTGTGPGRFSSPRGIAARYNSSLGYFDVYVADTGNNRVQKFAFKPASAGVPARMDYVCSWGTASTTNDKMSNPSGIAVALDNQTLGSSQACYLAVADQGNKRIAIYKDNAAMSGGGTTAPAWDVSLGSQGTTLGTYMQPAGLTFLQNGNNLDLFATDALRGTVTKYEEAPTPAIVLTFTGVNALACFPPTSSYTFSFSTTNPPTGGTVDFYYDTQSTFNSSTAKPCLTLGSTAATATSAVWKFSTTPTATPLDNSSYYLFAQMKDENGTVVATDQSDGDVDGHLCIDSSLLPSIKATDAIDGDYTISLQNGGSRIIDLQIAYPESIIAVGFAGTFDPTMVEVTGITPGNGWEGLGGTPMFEQTYDNSAGTFLVMSSNLGGNPLADALSHTMAKITVKTRSAAMSGGTAFKNGAFAFDTGSSSMTDVNNSAPAAWRVKSANLRLAYLGDLATSGESGIGADSTLPHLALKPDGKINFTDQMVFTVGWNGNNYVQDRISDIGPTSGSVPDLVSIPDGNWNVEDILAFSVMFSWYNSGQGASKAPAGDGIVNRVFEARPAPLGTDVQGTAEAFTVSHLSSPQKGELVSVDLNVNRVRGLTGALMNLGFDASKLELVSVENGGFLNGEAGSLFFNRAGSDWVEVSASRLDKKNPGVDGSGTIARLTFRILDETAGDLNLSYDLRSSEGTVLARGTRAVGPYSGAPAGLQLYSANPNPMGHSASIVFSLPGNAGVSLSVYDVTGRRVRNLLEGRQDSGYHVVSFNGRSDDGSQLPNGIYFYRLQTDGKQITKKLTLSR